MSAGVSNGIGVSNEIGWAGRSCFDFRWTSPVTGAPLVRVRGEGRGVSSEGVVACGKPTLDDYCCNLIV